MSEYDLSHFIHSEAAGTLADTATPSVAAGNLWVTGGTTTITNFTGGTSGQIITVVSAHALTFDVTGTNLKGGSIDIVVASGDTVRWASNGTNWYLIQFMDVTADHSVIGGGGTASDDESLILHMQIFA